MFWPDESRQTTFCQPGIGEIVVDAPKCDLLFPLCWNWLLVAALTSADLLDPGLRPSSREYRA
ncbi:hypothetical protein CIHG_09195 [Coccidioides immitis H538.4]|uniref:Uncharacterized protein n=3 Tax=Coccidioides immitis TaxID=5501 RepID=A0A0J8R7W8_COCIT|nr:hypothetical protein CIRG_05951 [Coccidioides immitis RMSCC 2394]KMU80525.1 hypothetical protein CISG_02376 [Coccidioides immitis RMSCC 3703]KMU91318.1 hypothetical protein CIHG_09195 [Coccidioides immitis H538.4]